ncbi:MAG: hypothetical protein U0894_09040 [Pirellulales bacterium]
MYDFEIGGAECNFFGLTIIGYQYPNEPLEPSDDNPVDEFDTGRFLVIECHFVRNEVDWKRSGPFLSTDDLAKLRDWMVELPLVTIGTVGCYFTERDLELSYDASRKALSIHASYELNSPVERSGQTTTLVFRLDDSMIASLVGQLENCIRRFPGRPNPV